MASFEFILQRQRHDPFLFHCVILFSNILFGNTTEHQTQIHNQQTNTKQAKPENNQSEERKKERKGEEQNKPGGSKANIMREHRGTIHIVVPMNRVHTIYDGYPKLRFQGQLLKPTNHVGPIR